MQHTTLPVRHTTVDPTPATLIDVPATTPPGPAALSLSAARLQTGRALMATAAVGALLSAVSSVAVVAAAGPQTQMVETWRGYGYLVFAGLFAVLALRPRHYRGVWELTLLHKAA